LLHDVIDQSELEYARAGTRRTVSSAQNPSD
jgi:hypothetical protein